MVSSVLFIICCRDRHIEQSKQTQRGNTISLSVHQTGDDRAESLRASVYVCGCFVFENVKARGQNLLTGQSIFYNSKSAIM